MRRFLVLLSVLTLLAAGAACGSDDDSESDAGAGDTAPPVKLTGTTNNHGLKDASGQSGEIELELDDFYFGPTFIKAKAGQSLSLKLHNEGSAPHTFTAGSVDEQLAPDATKTVTVTAPSSGALVFYCRFHQGQGMQGAVYLNEGDSVQSGGSTSSTAPGYGY